MSSKEAEVVWKIGGTEISMVVLCDAKYCQMKSEEV